MYVEEIIRTTINAAYEVYSTRHKGFIESVYQNALLIEPRRQDLKVEKEKDLQVLDKGEPVGNFRADILVEDCLILELKAVQETVLAHELQLVTYLKGTGIDNGLLINFGADSFKPKRKFRLYSSPTNSNNFQIDNT